MEEAAKRNIAFFVLDRPNPLGGEIIEGPMLDADKTNFVAYFPLPVRYGLTIAELAQFFNAENHIGADLHVITMRNWDWNLQQFCRNSTQNSLKSRKWSNLLEIRILCSSCSPACR